jgi:hypothetical protein
MWAENPEIQNQIKKELDIIFSGDSKISKQELRDLQKKYDVKRWQIIEETKKSRWKFIKEIDRQDIIFAIKNFQEYKEWREYFNSLSIEEKKELQWKLGLKKDGNYWPQTFFALYNYSQEQKKLIRNYNINKENEKVPLQQIRNRNDNNKYYEYKKELNGKLKWRKDFIVQFWVFTSMLSSQIGISQWYVNAIIHQETKFWLDLDHSWGSRWLMQLTKRPLKDMHGDVWKKIWISSEQSKKYIPLFQQLDIQALKNIDMWNGNKIEDSLPSDVWRELEEISDKNNPISINRFQDIIAHFHILLKNPKDKTNYYHVLNMIIASIYLKTKIMEAKWNLQTAAVNYNGNSKLKYRYGREVMNWYNNKEKNK